MRRNLAAWVKVSVLSDQACRAPQSVPPWRQTASVNIVGLQDPQTDCTRQAVFRVYVPDVRGTRVDVANPALTKDKACFRTGASQALDPGFHCCTINLDGAGVRRYKREFAPFLFKC